jgi:hypothetical protein
MREISRSVQNDQQAKKKSVDCTVCTVHMDVDMADRMTRGRDVQHVAGNHVNSWHMTWLIFGEWDDDTWHYHDEWFGATWPRHGLPHGTM